MIGQPLAVPAETPSFRQRSTRHEANARPGKAVKKAERWVAQAEEELRCANAALGVVTNLFLGAPKLLGQSEHTVFNLLRKGVKPQNFLLLARALHLPASANLNMGVKLWRRSCFTARLVEEWEVVSLTHTLESSGRRAPGRHKDIRQLVTTHTLVQRGVVGVLLCDLQREEGL